MNQFIKNINQFIKALLNSYSVLFFSNNNIFAILLLLVSFFNPYAGLAGLVAVLIALILSYTTGLNKFFINKGTYSYNALIIGLGMGTFYNYNVAFFTLLAVVSIFSVILSVVLQNKLSAANLPFLTIPFVLCFWIVLLVTKSISAIPFTQRNIYWINNVYEVGSSGMVNFLLYFDRLEMPLLVSTFFRALSSLYFQNNILSGIIIAIGMLIHSRIIFTLLILGFLAAFGFNYIVLAHPTDVSYYLLGDNYILVTVAIGGFFTIPSKYSYGWAMLSVPITFIIVVALSKVLESSGLPVFSMPFCITVLSLLMFFQLKQQKNKLLLTSNQLYKPESNLYHYLNNAFRLQHSHHIRLQLPFLGQWMVSQGYNGNITHKEDWSKALDFIVVDNQLKTYTNYALKPEDFYGYNKPVLAPADGFVQFVEDYIEDNEVGKINQEKNWGNTIVLKHAEGLYTKLCHLKNNSIKVAVGAFVKQGDVLATCGNSGRSPEPHLHFQVQTTPYIGSKTFAYPISYFIATNNGVSTIKEFSIPKETELVNNVTINLPIKQAFEFLPGYNLFVKAENEEEQKWEVFTDAYNNSYIYCHTTKSVAYFKKTELAFYFTSFDGNKKSLLYQFYIAAYKILFTADVEGRTTDKFPLQISKFLAWQWLQDVLAPFYIFSKLHFESYNNASATNLFQTRFQIFSQQVQQVFQYSTSINKSIIQINENRIEGFSFIKAKKEINVICQQKNF